MTNLVLIRHGETDWNVEGRYQGQADPPLNERGVAQSIELAEHLEMYGLNLLYSSPLKRCSQTAEMVARRLGIPLHLEPRLMEIHQGDWQTRLRAEINELYPELFRRWESEPWEVSPPNGESLYQVQERVVAAVEEIKAKYPQDCVGLVTHRVPIALLKVKYQGMDREIVRTLHLPNIYIEQLEI
jgi:broad specificity phosphatase PhoE